MESPLSQPEPNDPPRRYCSKHETVFDPYKESCWPCEREAIHAHARDEWSQICHDRVDVELAPVENGQPLERGWVGDAFVKWRGESRLIRIREIDESDVSGPYRAFTLDGGFPIGWYEDRLTNAIASAIGRRIMALVKLK